MPAANFDELCKKLTGEDLSKASEVPVSSEVDGEIKTFLKNKASPAEGDITEFAKYLTMRYGGNDKIERDLAEKMFIRIILLKMKAAP